MNFPELWKRNDAATGPPPWLASRAVVAEMRALSPAPPVIRVWSAEDVTATLMG
ncbi:MAG TPA: hypothetical protein PKD99_10865 [Sphingopyxis sp.]|nr:hypothetical protein [Sphingopyxis sp.]HMP45597.1 hypothetical protein [Sphingopyxis sp.]HMQ17937.1 hypothetical protein [Sphingopyxis sp.]